MIENPEDSSAPIGDKTARARKTAAKKTAAKKTAKKAAKKATAKKAASRKSPTESIIETPVVTPVVQAELFPAPKKKSAAKKAAKKATTKTKAVATPPAETPQASTPPPREAAAPQEPQREEAPRFGRVPGGGPLVSISGENTRPAPVAAPVKAAAPAAPREAEAQEAPSPRAESIHTVQESPQEQRQRHHGGHEGHGGRESHRDGRDGRNKKRRRDRRNRNRGDREHGPHGEGEERHGDDSQQERRPHQLNGPKVEVNGMLELAPKGFGFLRVPEKRFEQARDDVFVPPETIRRLGLRVGQWIHGMAQEGHRGPQLVEVTSVNGLDPAEVRKLPVFDELKAINPTKRIPFETTTERATTRVVDIIAPVGRGQRGLIVSPPRSGKTTMLLHIAEALRERYEENLHLMVLLVDERPEEVTEFRRCLPGTEIYASSNDDGARNHCRIAELAIERAKRLVEAGKDVFILMDSITRLARAYNNQMRSGRGRGIASGGLVVGALETPRRLFAAARNTREAGSLTILATALVQTNSRADEAIFQEFKGTGNMELVLDRKIAENYIYPAVDIFKSGTRREELLLPEHMLHKIHLIRRGLSGHRPVEGMERLNYFIKKFPNNAQMLLEIKG